MEIHAAVYIHMSVANLTNFMFCVQLQYFGMVKNQIGMEAWGRSLIIENHPNPDGVKEVSFLTNLKRDSFLGEKC